MNWKFPFWLFERFLIWLFERCSFLIWLLILLFFYIYFNWEKSFEGRIWLKSKNDLFDSKSFKLNVVILNLLLIFILYYYSWRVFVLQSHCYFNDVYLLVYLQYNDNACALLQKWSLCLISDVDFFQMKINKFNGTRKFHLVFNVRFNISSG